MPRIRLSIGTHEVDIEGSEQFIAEHKSLVTDMLCRLPKEAASVGEPPAAEAAPSVHPVRSLSELDFGEVLFMLPDTASGTDKVLLAGKFAQLMSDNSTFDTREANQLLLGQGVKLANPSQSLKNNLKAKRVFKFEGRYRVSRDGETHIESVVSQTAGEPR